MEVKVGKKYRHFKGYIMEVLALAKHSETKEDIVVYKHIDDDQVWVRPYDMFTSPVDHEKYRFEEVDE